METNNVRAVTTCNSAQGASAPRGVSAPRGASPTRSASAPQGASPTRGASATRATRATIAALAVGVLAALAGCNDNPAPGSAAYKEGELGNGDFLFACDDGLACLPYKGDAKLFPKQISTGSNFDVRFVAKGQQGTTVTIDDKRYEGVTVQAVAPYVSQTPDGELAAIAPGFGTVIARDSAGTVIDYVTLKIVRPDDLIVYDAAFDATKNREPPRIQAITLKVDEAPSYRVVAEYGGKAAAGSVPVKWESNEPDILTVESYASGVVNLRAKGAGKAILTATGASLEKKIDVEVKL
ncbi:MAG: hypothetical protein KF764_20455 [Labilithrix sp.]|nr:hypothetical protein [Labilithrix sp.]